MISDKPWRKDPDDDDVSGSDFTIKFTSNSILIKKLPRFHCATERFTKCIMWTVSDRRKLRKISEKRYKDYRQKYQNKDGQTVAILFFNEQGEMQSRGFRTDELEQLLNEISKDNK